MIMMMVEAMPCVATRWQFLWFQGGDAEESVRREDECVHEERRQDGGGRGGLRGRGGDASHAAMAAAVRCDCAACGCPAESCCGSQTSRPAHSLWAVGRKRGEERRQGQTWTPH